MRVLENLEPQRVLYYFEELCRIPHGSGNIKEISDYCVSFANRLGLECFQDDTGNVIIKKPAALGYENAEPIIIQGHLDMVCEKEPGCDLNMEKEGLRLGVDGDYIYAKETTLGGDDGIAVAIAMALLEAEELKAPKLEVLFTVNEETGMDGAIALDMSHFQGRRMLNLDSEDEGVFTVSCAGGNTTMCTLPVIRTSQKGMQVDITLEGLTGGHSGMEINKGRGNANILMGRVLYELEQRVSLGLIGVNGGLKGNAIPMKCQAEILIKSDDKQKVLDIIEEYDGIIKKERQMTDPNLSLSCVSKDDVQADVMDKDKTSAAIALLCCIPNGVISMSMNIEGLVQTSLNLGILTTTADNFQALCSVRSSVATEKTMVIHRLEALMKQMGGSAEVMGDYPAWEYRKDSPLRELMVKVFKEQYGKEPKIEAIHAGLECGLFSGKMPDLDCVSMGPDLVDIHTSHEKMSISSLQRTWKYIVRLLEQMR